MRHFVHHAVPATDRLRERRLAGAEISGNRDDSGGVIDRPSRSPQSASSRSSSESPRPLGPESARHAPISAGRCALAAPRRPVSAGAACPTGAELEQLIPQLGSQFEIHRDGRFFHLRFQQRFELHHVEDRVTAAGSATRLCSFSPRASATARR